MSSQLLSMLVQVILAVLLPALVLIIKAAAQRAIAALGQLAEARIADSDRAALYAAVKIGLRVAEKNGVTVDGVWQKALGQGVDMALEYLTRLGISDLSPSYIKELIEVESHKVSPLAKVWNYSEELGYWQNIPQSAIPDRPLQPEQPSRAEFDPGPFDAS